MANNHKSSLKQQNKKRSTLGHKSKREFSRTLKGRVEKVTISKKVKQVQSRDFRREQAKQIRKDKQEGVLLNKARLGSSYSAPFLVTIVPLSLDINPRRVLSAFESLDDICITNSSQGIVHVSSRKYKQRFSFLIPPMTDIISILDATKVSNTVLFLWDGDEDEISESTRLLLTALKSQGMPSSFHVLFKARDLADKKKKKMEKNVLSFVSAFFPGETKLHSMDKAQNVEFLLRMIGSQKQNKIFYRDERPHMIAEKIVFEKKEETPLKGNLKVYGYLRGKPLDPNSLVHIPDCGDFQILKIESCSDPHPLIGKKSDTEMYEENKKVIALPNENEQESLEEPEAPADDPMEEPSLSSILDDEIPSKRATRKLMVVPKGTSEYQAHWLSDDEEESSSEYSEEDNHYMEVLESEDEEIPEVKCPTDDETDGEDEYDTAINPKEEMDALDRMQAAQDNLLFPDEVELRRDELARVRFSKYRPLESFRKSEWREDEDETPSDYSRISKLNVPYDHAKKTIFRRAQPGVKPGAYIVVTVADVPQHVYQEQRSIQGPLVLFGILPLEQKMSVMNVLLHSSKIGHYSSIKSKENLIFHVGYRRFSNSPIFSENTYQSLQTVEDPEQNPGGSRKQQSKHKLLRYFHPGETVVASFYAPMMFAPCPVTVFKQRPDGSHDLVATGRIRNVDPNRLIVKRAVLTGVPYKVNKRSAVIRFMFFNREDIEYYKKVELRTKYGRRGHIKVALGSHGHMKCIFDGPLKADDTIKLCLYKRSFPKWTYGPHVPRSNSIYLHQLRSLTPENDDVEVEESSAQPARKRVRFIN